MGGWSRFLRHSEETVSCDRGSYPLQEVLRPSLGHSDSAASGPSPQIKSGVWSRSLAAGPSLLTELLPQGAGRGASGGHVKDRCSMAVETPPCSSLSLLSTVLGHQGTRCEDSGLHRMPLDEEMNHYLRVGVVCT